MAAFFWIHAGANNNVGTVNNWSATSGGGTNSATPGVTSDVTYDGAGANGNDASTVAASVSFLSLTFTTGYTNTITISANFALTVAGNFTDRTNHTWVNNSNAAGSLTISAASTITSNGKTFPGAVSFTGSNTKTISGDWTITGTLTLATATTTVNKTTAETISVGGLTVSGTSTGTINITVNNGTWSGTSANTISGTLTIQGTSTISGTVLFSTGTLVGTSGTFTTTGSTLTVGASTTLNTSAISWNIVGFQGNSTITINSLLTASTITFASNNITFAGSAAFTTATLTVNATQVQTYTLVHALTYTITTAFNCFTSRTGSIGTFTSDDRTTKAILTLNNGATCNVLASFTRIDASNGRAIYAFNGTITTCNNIFSFNDALPPARSMVIHAGASY